MVTGEVMLRAYEAGSPIVCLAGELGITDSAASSGCHGAATPRRRPV